jgi:formate hydrogenlyase subunit 3/multisubunit Na+/H+ antiporter MnhD subunit
VDRQLAVLDRLHARQQRSNQTRFYVCFALALAATMGIAFAGNLFTLFVFYEALTLITYPLVTHHGTDKPQPAVACTSAS